MQLQDCKVGTRVALVSKTQPCNKGVVKSEPEAHKTHGHVAIVEWDSGSLQKVTLRSLLTEAEGVAQDARIKEETERLQRAWEATELQVTQRLAQAAKLIDEATDLAQAAGKDVNDMYEATRPLMRALDNAGWRTSSLSC